MVNLSEDIHPLTAFKRNTSGFMSKMKKTRRPLVLTLNGKPELVVQDAESYQQMLDHIDRMEALQGIKRGLADVEAGRVTSLKHFARDFRKKRGLPSRTR